MTQEPRKPINLSVHETADPQVINPSPNTEVTSDVNDLNDSVHDQENVDVPTPRLSDAETDIHPVDRQLNIVNRSAG
ncbi:hypothetical protein [Brasilonema sp. UFV-L1]|uniref:hypothetical protein n=1 Tax=Brasilonema sp. UFV-L1 TaxID=2234130 RepID=UPI00145CDE46|nr:hypothetical protein [Brasilonema sp. UFV-L1]NMG05354.1 hypothetical protein [Brasilonema sp. UFV-L1]